MENFNSTEWIPGLPVEMGLECLIRIPYPAHQVASGVCRKWRELLQCPEFYNHRRRLGYTCKVACLIQVLPPESLPDESKPRGSPRYGPSKCPRSCVAVTRDGRLVNLAESSSGVRIGACGVTLGELTLLTGSEYQGGPQRLYFGGQDGKFEKMSMPEDFSGFVQSGCCVEI
ncbi:hypothetical protein SAY87_013035 [Trapa incisa]|uniref:F-box domain-containing protein n=1 Tax=Trapa incisa TaxID=236973 RepID=A0AAN7KHA7_9MYRT|nr:hypothetical protein SAY87_013035 [Trapa incisa]